jgi:hypothetical protein
MAPQVGLVPPLRSQPPQQSYSNLPTTQGKSRALNICELGAFLRRKALKTARTAGRQYKSSTFLKANRPWKVRHRWAGIKLFANS